MDALLRAVRKSPTVIRDQFGKSRHKKLAEGWNENKEAVYEGVTFYLKYLGSTLLEELPEGESYGDGISARAVQSIVAMAKSAGKKLKKVSLAVTPKGLHIIDLVTKDVAMEISIYRISFCTADKTHERLFAFIERNTINETMQCHAYLCPKRKIAQAVTLTVSQAFNLARDVYEEKQLKKRHKTQENHSKNTVCNDVPTTQVVIDDKTKKITYNITPACTAVSTSSNDTNIRIPKLEAPKSTKVTLQSSKCANGETNNHNKWEEFSDDDEVLDDTFSRFATNRSRGPVSFSTDLRREDLDDSVEQYMDGKRCFEEFSRQMSIEDLLNL